MRTISKALLLACFLMIFSSACLQARGYIYHKVAYGTPFVYFDIGDIYNQRWVSTYLRGKPIIILTGHRYQRYEIIKWAEAFRSEYGSGQANILWVVNLRKFPWTTSRETIVRQWRDFNSSVPVLMDWEGVIGKSLRVNYSVPNIVLIDSFGRLIMHEMATYSSEVYSALSLRMQNLLSRAGSAVIPVMYSPVSGYKKTPRGRKGDSN